MASIYNSIYNDMMRYNHSTKKPVEKTYISLVKIKGKIWGVAKSESTNLQEHIDYIESLRNKPNVEEAKVMEFTKITGYRNDSAKKMGEPDLDKIL